MHILDAWLLETLHTQPTCATRSTQTQEMDGHLATKELSIQLACCRLDDTEPCNDAQKYKFFASAPKNWLDWSLYLLLSNSV